MNYCNKPNSNVNIDTHDYSNYVADRDISSAFSYPHHKTDQMPIQSSHQALMNESKSLIAHAEELMNNRRPMSSTQELINESRYLIAYAEKTMSNYKAMYELRA
ncbi:hypothetical protein [Pseudanabaena sp. lw0831]|uniref:hypothetical protein n=1 Tax=Pseudanabaena sp. lw0831 TaxID=1357935 RepID=UPI0019152620|nr:hypothetical protein [Pseudanabaena sp. lw0831]